MPEVLSEEQLERFERRGFVRLPEAFDRTDAEVIQAAMWRELQEDFGIRRDDRATWRQPERDLERPKTDPLQERMATPRLVGAVQDLLAVRDWEPPPHWGRVLITFPEPPGTVWTLPTGPWHWDCALAENVSWPPRRLVIFTFFSNVEPRGGGTLIVSGSHRLLETFHDGMLPRERKADHRKLRRKFLRWDAWVERLGGGHGTGNEAERIAYFMDEPRSVRGVDLLVEELTGSPGDAILCHPLMLHTTAPNCLDAPRFMRIRFPGR